MIVRACLALDNVGLCQFAVMSELLIVIVDGIESSWTDRSDSLTFGGVLNLSLALARAHALLARDYKVALLATLDVGRLA